MSTQDIRGDKPLFSFEEVSSASRQLLMSIYGLVPHNAFTEKLLYYFDKMSNQNPEIDLLPLLIAWPKIDNILSAAPLIVAWQLLRFSAKLFDDVEDENVNKAELINLGTGFHITAQQVIFQLKIDDIGRDRILEIHSKYNLAALKACSGQHEDLLAQSKNTWMNPDVWLEIAHAKSGELFAWATWAGAYFAGYGEVTTAHYQEFGNHLGGLIQIADDYNDVWGSGQKDEMTSYQNSLPFVYAQFVANSDQKLELKEISQEVSGGNLSSKGKLEKFLVNLGAQKYILAVGWLQKQRAIEALQKVDRTLDSQRHLLDLLNNIFPSLP